MESHDYSISSKVSRHSQHTAPSNSSGDVDDVMSDSGSAQGNNPSICSKSTLSVSPNREAGEVLMSMALAQPTSLRKVENPSGSGNSSSMPFPIPQSMPWRTTSLSKPATVLLDSADSVSSAGTSTTAESSLTAALVSRDWAAIPHASTSASAGVSVSSQQGESPASTPGVYFQCGHPRLLGSHVHVAQGCPTSSLTHALNRFNIDSDCEASIASNSIVEDHIMDDDDATFDDAASHASVNSHTSAGSAMSQRSSASHNIRRVARKKKIGKTQRLMDRAAAHERILQVRSDRSQKMRANVVQSQRTSQVTISGLSSALAHEPHHQLSDSPGSTTSSQSSIPLMHVNHGSSSSQALAASLERHPLHSMGDLGRTPTASNCSDLRKLSALGPPSQYLDTLPTGVHIAANGRGVVPIILPGSTRKTAPLGYHPQLACRLPTPPPNIATGGMIVTNNNDNSNKMEEDCTISKPALAPAESREADDTKELSAQSLEHMNHTKQATVDDVMEVAMTLSKLGSVRTGPVPRFR